MYEDHQTDDQVAACRGQRGAAPGAGVAAGLLVEVLPQRLHPAPAVRRARPEDVPQDRLPRRRAAPGRLLRTPGGSGPGRAAPLLDALLRRQEAAKKGEFLRLLVHATARAQEGGLIPDKPTAAVDATGMESR